MDSDDLLVEVREVFRDVFDDPNIEIARESNADSIPDWDSLAHINLLMTIQRRFKVKFTLIDMQHLKDVGDLLVLLERKITEREK
jgi:acyl carrier protein